eukprot:m.4713 g.4713  ORF g.4713 m.4713 type:complete len:333 (+) comp11150_c0_seq1:12-1010(+)
MASNLFSSYLFPPQQRNKELLDLKQFFKKNGKIKDFQAHESKAHSVDWNSDGRKVASGSTDKTVSVFSLDKYGLTRLYNYKGHSDHVDQLCWHPSHPEYLVSASEDKTIRIWDARVGHKCAQCISTKGDNINICWSPDGNTIAVGNKDDLITWIDTRNYKTKSEMQFNFEVNEISWNNSSEYFFLTNGHGCIVILSFPELKTLKTLQAHSSNCISLEFDSQGRYFATGSADALASLWDLDELVCIRTFTRLVWPVRTLSFSYDGKMLAMGSEDHHIDIALVDSGEEVFRVPCNASTFCVAWHPNKYLLAFVSDDKDRHERDAGTVRLFGVPE